MKKKTFLYCFLVGCVCFNYFYIIITRIFLVLLSNIKQKVKAQEKVYLLIVLAEVLIVL